MGLNIESNSIKETIVGKIEAEDFQKKKFENSLINEVKDYIDRVELHALKTIKTKQLDATINSEDNYYYLRCKERYQNSVLLHQYLLTFLHRVPSNLDLTKETCNPFEQFKTFIRKCADSMKDQDVSQLVYQINHSDKYSDSKNNSVTNIEDYYQEIIELIDSAKYPTPRYYKNLFLALKKLSIFWFCLKEEDISKVRKSDIYTYKLAKILLERVESFTFS
jgi:hypothetical protein